MPSWARITGWCSGSLSSSPGVESVRTWVRDRDAADGLSGPDAQRVRELEAKNRELSQQNRELTRANEILKKASAFFAAELDRPQK